MVKKHHVYQEPGFGRQALCSLMGSLWGPVAGAFSAYGSVALPSFERDPDAPFFITEDEKAFFTSVPFLSAIAGSLIAGLVTARFGRKNVLAWLLLPLSASWLTIALARTFQTWVGARLVMGFCAGMVMLIGQVYLTEIAAPGTRGFITSTTMFFQLFYGLVNYSVGSALSWKWLACVNAAIHLAHVPIAFFIPESPAWLLLRSREARAKRSLQFLRGGPDADVDAEFAELQGHIQRSKTSQSSAKDIFRLDYLKPVILLCIFVALRQYTGAFAVISYTVDIFKSAGGSLSPNMSTIIVGGVQVLFNALSNCITDKIGRKRLIVGSGIGMGVSHAVFGFYYYMQNHPDYTDMARRCTWIPLVALIIFSIGFALGFASALFVLMSELIPMKIKAHASGVASIVNHVTNFTVVEFFFRMKHSMTEAGTFWFYGSVCFASAIYYAVLVPETNGKSLQELEEKLTKSRKAKKKAKDIESEESAATCPCQLGTSEKSAEFSFDNPAYIVAIAYPGGAICTAGNLHVKANSPA